MLERAGGGRDRFLSRQNDGFLVIGAKQLVRGETSLIVKLLTGQDELSRHTQIGMYMQAAYGQIIS